MSKLKLRLNLDHLHIESFATQPAREGARGTVQGHELDDTTTFDLGNYTAWCTVACEGGTLACEPNDPNRTYRLPNTGEYNY